MVYVNRYSRDLDGRLYVTDAPITKSGVFFYRASELKDAPRGNPSRTVAVFRPSWEKKNAAASFRNVPVLSEHTAQPGGPIDRSLIVGVTGDALAYKEPYLAADMILWNAMAMDFAFASKAAEQLSAAYSYELVWQHGSTFDGKEYDAIQTNLQGLHVALVPYGRCGSDVSINRKVSVT